MTTRLAIALVTVALIAVAACNKSADAPAEPAPYGVTLTAPAADHQFPAGQDAVLEFAYDAAAVTELGAWIEMAFDGKRAGMCAGTEMTSPYSFDVPAAAMKAGKHEVTFKLMDHSSDGPVCISELTVPIQAVD